MHFNKFFCSIFLLSISCSSFASLEEITFATWNMQGANAGVQEVESVMTGMEISAHTENRWRAVVANIVRSSSLDNSSGYDVISLQEAGAYPPTATTLNEYIYGYYFGTVSNPTYRIARVRELSWNVGTDSRPRILYIYHMAIDQSRPNLRTNLAIISRYRATRVLFLSPRQNSAATDYGRRPILGATFHTGVNGNVPIDRTFYSIHASSYGRNSYNEADNILRAINEWHSPTDIWVAMGDFNRDQSSQGGTWPIDIAIPDTVVAVFPTQATQTRGGILDGFFISQAAASDQAFNADIVQLGYPHYSDHEIVGISRSNFDTPPPLTPSVVYYGQYNDEFEYSSEENNTCSEDASTCDNLGRFLSSDSSKTLNIHVDGNIMVPMIWSYF